MPEVTDWARDILTRSLHAARRFNPDVVIRVVRKGPGVMAELAAEPAADDEPLPFGDGAIVVAEGIEGMLDITEPHAQLVLKPAGSAPNERAHD